MGNAEKIMRGIAIILTYDPEADASASHDEIFCGHGICGEGKMSPEDALMMVNLDWDFSSASGSWRFDT